VVGDLTDAVRDQGMRMALYYSGGLDWAFNEARIEDVADVWGTIVQSPEFVEYSVAHWKELIDRYQPSIMWNDIGYPAAADLGALFAYYYNSVPDGVINDRFTQSRDQRPKAGEKLTVPRGPHFDYITPEYATFDEIQDGKWECCRGIGHSFGYNRAEGDGELLAEDEMIHMFVDIVSKNGNLLLNVGPRADGVIPAEATQLLLDLGAWLDVNGEAIYGTRHWERFGEGDTAVVVGHLTERSNQPFTAKDVRFTQKGNALYAIVLGWPGSEAAITSLGSGSSLGGRIRGVSMLGSDEPVTWKQDDNALTVSTPSQRPCDHAYTFRIELHG